MSLDPTACAANINAKYQGAIVFPPVGDYPSDFATAYDDYVKEGVVIGALNTGGDKALIEAAMGVETTAAALGAAFAAYWSTVALVPAPPNLSAVNNAAALGAAFAAAVTASITDVESVPYFGDFITNIETAAKTVVWTITPPPPAAPFPSGIT